MSSADAGAASPRRSRTVTVGGVSLGGTNPVRVQTMWKAPLGRTLDEEERRIALLQGAGCEIIRFAVPDDAALGALRALTARISLPVVADIHFDHRLALQALDFVHKIRINPGNIGAAWKVREVLSKASDRDVPVRVGINGGSLPRALRGEPDKGRAMVAAAEAEIDLLERSQFRNAVFSLKSSDVDATIRANTEFSSRYDYPLHLGLTEAGPLIPGLVKSSVALVRLLEAGIGATIRVSLSGPCEDEVYAAMEILAAAGLSRGGVRIVSCPKCARASFDVHAFLEEVGPWLRSCRRSATVAVMGCVVNGPEEAKHADFGITGAGKYALLFKKGNVERRVAKDEAFAALRSLMEEEDS